MDVTDSKKTLLNNLLKMINQELKKKSLLADFDIDSMHYDKHRPTNGFLDSLAPNSYFPYVIQPS